MTKAQRAWAQEVATRPPAIRPLRSGRAGRRRARPGHRPHQLIKGLGRAPVLLALIGWQLEGDDRDRQLQRPREPARVVLDQLCRARRPDQHRLGLEAIIGLAHRVLEQGRRVGAEIARLEGGVGDRRALFPPLDHGEQQVCVGIALRGVQHVVHPLHRGRDPHGADVGGTLICPQGELHRLRPPAAPDAPAAARRARRGRPPAHSPGSA